MRAQHPGEGLCVPRPVLSASSVPGAVPGAGEQGGGQSHPAPVHRAHRPGQGAGANRAVATDPRGQGGELPSQQRGGTVTQGAACRGLGWCRSGPGAEATLDTGPSTARALPSPRPLRAPSLFRRPPLTGAAPRAFGGPVCHVHCRFTSPVPLLLGREEPS